MNPELYSSAPASWNCSGAVDSEMAKLKRPDEMQPGECYRTTFTLQPLEFMTIFAISVRMITSHTGDVYRVVFTYGAPMTEETKLVPSHAEYIRDPSTVVLDTMEHPELTTSWLDDCVASLCIDGAHIKCSKSAPNASLFCSIYHRSEMVQYIYQLKFVPIILPKKGELETTSGVVYGKPCSALSLTQLKAKPEHRTQKQTKDKPRVSKSHRRREPKRGSGRIADLLAKNLR